MFETGIYFNLTFHTTHIFLICILYNVDVYLCITTILGKIDIPNINV
jgi:hypothetical protein